MMYCTLLREYYPIDSIITQLGVLSFTLGRGLYLSMSSTLHLLTKRRFSTSICATRAAEISSVKDAPIIIVSALIHDVGIIGDLI